jgi:hypothetical protein
MKTSLSLLITFFIAIQLSAQCRIARIETSDSSNYCYFSYDKQGRIAIDKTIYKENGKNTIQETQFTYNTNDKVASVQMTINDTLFLLQNWVYQKDKLTDIFATKPQDSTFSHIKIYYNKKGQAIRHFIRRNNGDTISSTYEYAPQGWVKRRIQTSNLPQYNHIIESGWDENQPIVDEPYRTFFAGYAFQPGYGSKSPVEPLSVKGNVTKWTLYKRDKDGKLTKESEGETFDVKANQQGLWIENKFRGTWTKNAVITYRAFYEGCKN